MSTPIRSTGGRFNGSVGAGSVHAPTTPPTAPTVTSRGAASTGASPVPLPGLCTRYTDEVVDGARQRCGLPTAPGKDWCGTCPGYKKATAPGDVNTSRPSSGPTGDGEVLRPEEVARCDGQVTDPRSGDVRQCKNAVRSPATSCHDHGGAIDTSLFKTHAKATAEANRGELTMPTARELAANPDAARAAMEHDLATLITTDPSAFLQMSAAVGTWNRGHAISRFSPNNQMMVLAWAYHLERSRDPDADPTDLVTRAVARARQPMHTKKGWEALGRTVNDDADAIPVIYFSPIRPRSSDEDEEQDNLPLLTRRRGGRVGARYEFFADNTTGDPLPEEPEDPLDQPLPPGHGDPAAYRAWLTDQAAAVGVDVVVDEQPPASGAKAYYAPLENRIHLWSGHADNDPATQAHVLAHELGHALDPKLDPAAYGSSGCNERGRAEVFAEVFAYLLTSRHGFNSVTTTAGYTAGWSRRFGGLGSKDTVAVMRDALTAAHTLMHPNGAPKE